MGWPVPVAAVSKGGGGVRPPAYWVRGLESPREHACRFFGGGVYRQAEVSATGRSPVQRNPTECDMYECNLETPMKRPRPTGGAEPREKNTCIILTR